MPNNVIESYLLAILKGCQISGIAYVSVLEARSLPLTEEEDDYGVEVCMYLFAAWKSYHSLVVVTTPNDQRAS